ncbi:MAG: c-type cytochrome [Steroidobacteraceae bacterium]
MTRARYAAAFLALAAWAGTAVATAPGDAERIYRAGILPSGQPLQGAREGGVTFSGQAAACVNCHRRSGIGVNEGSTVIPPISGKYLARPGDRALPEAAVQSAGTAVSRRKPYDDQTLARAIRAGIDSDGKPLGYLMPRYTLDPADMAVLIAYLKRLSTQRVPGVAHDNLEFATIVTPDADPAERRGMLDVLEHFFSNKNHFELGHDPQLVSDRRRIHYRVTYQWHLHVWELTGPPGTWGTQLREHFRAQPVFAVISGVGGRDWRPVHRFCQQQHLPCLFPNVRLPVVAPGDFYPLYFSRGVLLEADLIRARWQAARTTPRRVVQLFRQGDIGEAAARALRGHRSDEAIEWIDRPVGADGSAAELRAALEAARPGDTLVLWLRAADLRELPAEAPAADIFVSGLMGGLEDAPLPPAWRAAARLTYPVDLPQRRAMRLVQPLTWFRTQQIPVVAERVQVDTFIACQVLSEAVTHAFADVVPDYLIEQIENMISVKLLDGYYPRLGLAPGQRFASKGGYIIRLAPNPGGGLVVDSDWTVPQ